MPGIEYYFTLQARRLKRWFREMGLPYYVGITLAIAGFIALSLFIYARTQYANWIIIALGIIWLFQLAGKTRLELLTGLFSRKTYLIIRLVENISVCIPFFFLLLYHESLMQMVVLGISAIALIFYNNNMSISQVIPTPFRRLPYEHIIGFRKKFPIFILAYFILYQSINHDNYNLGIFSIAMIYLTSMTHYIKPEPKYFVWIYQDSTGQFLFRKIRESLVGGFLLSLPGVFILLWMFPSYWISTLVAYAVAQVFLSSIILAKYSAFPREMNIPQGILYALSLSFPPLLLFTLWIFNRQSVKNLKPILKC